MYYLYQITNQINEKIYIGITDNPKQRWSNHTSEYNIKTIKRPLYLAMKKYGKENFKFEIISEISSKQDALNEEIRLITEMKSLWTENGYNISSGGSLPSDSNKKASSEYMKKNNPMKKLRVNGGSFRQGQSPIITEERNEKIRKSKLKELNPNYGNKNAADHMNVNLICEHCKKTVSKGNYYRWHGDNCKQLQIQ